MAAQDMPSQSLETSTADMSWTETYPIRVPDDGPERYDPFNTAREDQGGQSAGRVKASSTFVGPSLHPMLRYASFSTSLLTASIQS